LNDAALLMNIIAKEEVSEETIQKYVDLMWEEALPAIVGSSMGGAKLLGFKGFKYAKEIDL